MLMPVIYLIKNRVSRFFLRETLFSCFQLFAGIRKTYFLMTNKSKYGKLNSIIFYVNEAG